MSFVTFRPERSTRGPRTIGEYASIRRNGAIVLSEPVYLNLLNSAERVELLFNEEANLLGIVPHDEKPSNGQYTLKVTPPSTPTSRTYSISASKFCQYFGLNSNRAQKFNVYWNDENNMLVVDLNSTYGEE